MKKSVLLFICIVKICCIQAQLNVGDIAFLGMNTDATEGYSIITLTDISGSEKIFFSDRGIISPSAYIAGAEGTYLFTAPSAGIPCGTIVSFEEDSPNVYTITGVTGATMVLQAGSANLGSGDQVYAYTTTTDVISVIPSDATFIAGIMCDYDASCVDATTKWTQSSCVSATSESIVPPGLGNTVNCISITPSGPEIDNMRYTGTLTGSSSFLRSEINNFTNWETNNSSAYDISPSGYGSPTVNCAPLPVELIKFQISTTNTYMVKLNWSTASELNNDFFMIQRSPNGTDWENLKEIKGAGDSNKTNNYEEIDESPLSGISYYRLKQTDYNNVFEYSKVESIQLNDRTLSELKISPNPARNEITILSESSIEESDIIVFNGLGQNVTIEISIKRISPKSLVLDVSKLSSGTFFIRNKMIINSFMIQGN